MKDKVKITYLTSSHYVNDDRIFYHIKNSLEQSGCGMSVCSSFGDTNLNIDNTYWVQGENLTRKERVEWFYEQLILLKPEVVICGEPLPIIAAKKYRKKYSCKIIYDVTEWYPSKKNLGGLGFLAKLVKSSVMFFYNLYAASLVDGFMVGEYYKKRLYDVFLPLKPKEIISYYPKRNYVSLQEKKINPEVFKIGYSGRFSAEKGIHRVFEVAEKLRLSNPAVKIILVLIGKTYNKEDVLCFNELKRKYSGLQVDIHEMVPFEKFSKAIAMFDVALDLRDNDIENTRCLPIKVFHYNACGIPVVYSDLKAIKKGYIQDDFCELVAPDDLTKTVDYLQRFIDSPMFYHETSKKAISVIEKKYLWECIEKKMLSFIKKLIIENK